MMKDQEEMDEKTKEILLHTARAFGKSFQYVVSEWEKVVKAVGESVADVAEQFGDIFAELPDLPRPPAEIRKDIKHEKNPLRLRQLNKELNKSYKVYKRKRG